MYAIIQTGGKQYRVAEGDTVSVEKLVAEEGAQVTFDQVLTVVDAADVKVGRPLVDGAPWPLYVRQELAAGAGDRSDPVAFARIPLIPSRQGSFLDASEPLLPPVPQPSPGSPRRERRQYRRADRRGCRWPECRRDGRSWLLSRPASRR